jgi:TetR/AcrR family transcriptional regulator, mexJK operon transcriptional repressor
MGLARRLVNEKTVLYGTTMANAHPSCPSRRQVRREARRDAILDVAAESFLEHGYAGTTMSAIAANLGGSKGTLWSYFSSKDILFAAVIDRTTEAFRAELSLILQPRDGIQPALRRFCVEYLRKLTSAKGIALNRLVYAETGRFPEVGRIFYDRAPRPTQDMLARFLAQAMDAGHLRRGDSVIAARQLVALCVAASHQQLLAGVIDSLPPDKIEAEVDCAMTTFMRAYAPDALVA